MGCGGFIVIMAIVMAFVAIMVLIREIWVKLDNVPVGEIVPDVQERTKTIITDLDGTVVKHTSSLTAVMQQPAEVLPGVIDRFNEWDAKGYFIVLITARPESMRSYTEIALQNAGLFWDHLIMGVGTGQRVLLNDIKPNEPRYPMAVAVNLVRDGGIKNVRI